MDTRGIFIVDGSHLFSSVLELWRVRPELNNKLLDLGRLSEALRRTWSLDVGDIIRVEYYFKKNDDRMKRMLIIPESDKPGQKDHWKIIECGEHLEAIPNEELQKISPKYRDHFARSEKGLDIKLACDALLLIADNRANNIVFLINDRDYIPLIEAIQSLGGNVYLTALDSKLHIQKSLTKLADKYLTLDSDIDYIFHNESMTAQPPQQI